MKKATAIVIDSAIDLPAEFEKKYNIDVIPLWVSLDGHFFRDRLDLPKPEFYRRVAADPSMVLKTSQPAPGEIKTVLNKALERGSQVILFTLSSRLSGTFQNALAAIKLLPPEARQRITVIDTLNVSGGSGLLVMKAVEWLESGLGVEETTVRVEYIRPAVLSLGYIETLDYAVRGGRLPVALNRLSKLFHLKVLPQFSDGRLVKAGIMIGSRNKVSRVVKRFVKKLNLGKSYWLGIVDTGEPKVSAALKTELEKSGLKIGRLFQVIGSPTLGAHAGPGTFCLFALAQ